MNTIKLSGMKTVVAMLSMILFFQVAAAQESKVIPSESKVVVLGTSNIHDWELTAESFRGNASFITENDQLKSADNFSFTVTVEGLKSGKGGMDKNTYKALKSREYGEITFQSAGVAEIGEITNGKYRVEVQGELTIAGVRKKVPLTFTAVPGDGIRLSGKTVIRMTDYNIEPPTALLGTIKTGETVTVDLNITYK